MIFFTSRFDWLILYKKNCPDVQLFKHLSSFYLNTVQCVRLTITVLSGWVLFANCLSGYSYVSVKAIFSQSKDFWPKCLWRRFGWQMRIVSTSVTNFQNVYWLLYCAAKSQFIMILTMFFLEIRVFVFYDARIYFCDFN